MRNSYRGCGCEWNGFETGAGPIVYTGYTGGGAPVQKAYVKGEKGEADEKPGGLGVKRTGSGVPCKIAETGQVFGTIAQAADFIGVTSPALARHMKKHGKCRGYTVVKLR